MPILALIKRIPKIKIGISPILSDIVSPNEIL